MFQCCNLLEYKANEACFPLFLTCSIPCVFFWLWTRVSLWSKRKFCRPEGSTLLSLMNCRLSPPSFIFRLILSGARSYLPSVISDCENAAVPTKGFPSGSNSCSMLLCLFFSSVTKRCCGAVILTGQTSEIWCVDIIKGRTGETGMGAFLFVVEPPTEGCQWLSGGKQSCQQSSSWLC